MMEHVIKVVALPLPRTLCESITYRNLETAEQDAFVEHVRYVQEIPKKIEEWLGNGSPPSELEPLVERLDLDLMINLGLPSGEQKGFSPWIVQVTWVTHTRPLTTFLKECLVSSLNEMVPPVGAEFETIQKWLELMRLTLQGLLDEFFESSTYDHAVAHLVAIHACLAGMRFGLGRVRLHYPAVDLA